MSSKYNHWRLEQDDNGLARLHFDHLDSSVNLLSAQALVAQGGRPIAHC